MFLLIGGLLGGILGEILQVMAPKGGTIQAIFTTSLPIGVDPPFTINLLLVKFTIGFIIKLTLLSFLGMFLGIFLYKNV